MNDAPSKLLTRSALLLLRFRIPALLLLLAVTAFAAIYWDRIPRDPSVEAMVLEDDPDLLAYNRFKEIFGNDELLLAALKVDDVFEPQVMRDVEALRARIAALPHIKEAVAYTSIETVRGEADALLVEPMIPEIPETAEGAAAVRARALAEKDYVGNLYSADGTTAAIIARLETLAKKDDTTHTRAALARSVRGFAGEAPFNRYRWFVAGTPVLKSDLAETQARENLKFEMVIFAMLSLFLIGIFRTVSGMLITLGTVQASIFMLMAAYYFSGLPLTMVSGILTPLMLIYGISSAVHLQTHYALHSAGGIDKRRAIAAAVAVTMVPCFFNALTTAVGFGSNLVSLIRPIREFAYFAGSGVLLSFVVSFLAIPILLSFAPAPGARVHAAHATGWRMVVLEWVVRLVRRRKAAVIAINVVLLGLSIWGISQIKVETRLTEYFRPDTPIRAGYDFIEQNLSGVSAMEIMIDTGRTDGMKEPAVLAAMDDLERYLTHDEPALTSVLSLNSFYRRIGQALHGDDPAFRKVPATRQEAGQYLLLYSMSGDEADLQQFASYDYRHGRISARITSLSSTELTALVGRVKARMHALFDPLASTGVAASVTGGAVLYANMTDQLITGQVLSFGLSLLLIGMMMFLVAGELGLGLVSLLPNLMPIAIVMGLMGFLGYPLDSTTAMIAPIALGMAVDSTIHFMVRFRREYLRRGDHDAAGDESIRVIGRTMLGTSLPLAAGFLVLTTSEFRPVFVFGLLSGIVAVLAMVFDLVLTPICMVLYRPAYRKRGLIDWADE